MEALRDYLVEGASLNNRIENRVYSNRVKQGSAFPAIVLTQINRNYLYSLSNELGISDQDIQIDVYDTSEQAPLVVREIAELVRMRLSGYRGQLNDDVFCNGATLGRGADQVERPTDASDNWIWRYSMDCRIYIRTTVPTHE